MDPFGTTRSRVCREHALISPESFVRAELPGWRGTQGIILIAPGMGANFVQYLALMDAGGSGPPAPAGVERVVYVLEGEVTLRGGGTVETTLGPGGFAFGPPDSGVGLSATRASRINVFEKRYVPIPGAGAPRSGLRP